MWQMKDFKSGTLRIPPLGTNTCAIPEISMYVYMYVLL